MSPLDTEQTRMHQVFLHPVFDYFSQCSCTGDWGENLWSKSSSSV